MFFGFQLTLGLMMVFYGYSVMKNPRVWGDQGRRAVKAEHFEEYCRQNGLFFLKAGLIMALIGALDALVSLSGALTDDELARYGRDSRVQGLSAAEAHGFLTGMDADAVVPQAHRAAARGAVWDAFFRQNLDLLPGALPQALRSVSASLLTDLTALDLDTLDRTLEFLANNEAQIETQVLPGDEQAGRYTLNEESLAAVQSFFNVSPTDGQASSASEP